MNLINLVNDLLDGMGIDGPNTFWPEINSCFLEASSTPAESIQKFLDALVRNDLAEMGRISGFHVPMVAIDAWTPVLNWHNADISDKGDYYKVKTLVGFISMMGIKSYGRFHFPKAKLRDDQKEMMEAILHPNKKHDAAPKQPPIRSTTMNKDYTHICIVLDASGSMSSIENDTKGSFNAFLKTQREAEGKTIFDLYQFSDEVKRIVEHVDLKTFTDDLMARYNCSGCTALNDAVCTAIDTLGAEFAAMKEEDRPGNVIFVIITDGMENASRRFSSEDVKRRIDEQTKVYNWHFQYLAANQDAFASGAKLGISRDYCENFVASSLGMAKMCSNLVGFVDDVRKGRK